MTAKNSNGNVDFIQRRYQQGPQSYQTGNRSYGVNGAPSPHVGGGLDKSGYQERDQKAKAKKDFLYSRMKSGGF